MKIKHITKAPFIPWKYTPTWHNLDFKVSSLYFSTWHENDLFSYNHLTFSEATQEYGLERHQFPHYKELKPKINISNNPLLPSEFTTDTDSPPDLIDVCLCHAQKTKWEKDLGLPNSNDFWIQTFKNIFSSITNTKLQQSYPHNPHCST